jgi:hypothetical protein
MQKYSTVLRSTELDLFLLHLPRSDILFHPDIRKRTRLLLLFQLPHNRVLDLDGIVQRRRLAGPDPNDFSFPHHSSRHLLLYRALLNRDFPDSIVGCHLGLGTGSGYGSRASTVVARTNGMLVRRRAGIGGIVRTKLECTGNELCR